MTAAPQDSSENGNDPQVPDWSPGQLADNSFDEQTFPQRESKFRAGIGAVDSALETTGSILTTVYGFILLAVAIVVFFVIPPAWFFALPVAAYGVYLMWPGGWKFVIY